MRRAIFSYIQLAVLSVSFVITAGTVNSEAATNRDPYKTPEVAREIVKVRDLLFDGRYKECVLECRRAQKLFPDLLVWRFAAMLAPQARMLELHNYSLERQYLSEWFKLEKLYKQVRAKRPLYAYDHLCMGGGLGIYGLHHARAGRFRKAFSVGLRALRELGRAKKADDANHDVYLGYGIYHYYRGVLSRRLKWLPLFTNDKRRGLKELDRARKGLFGEPLADLAELYLYKDEGKWAKGLKLARKIRRSYPFGKLLVQHEGYFLLRMGKFDAAIKKFDDVIAHDPQNGSLYVYRAAAFLGSNRSVEAEKDSRAAMNLRLTPPYKAYALCILGEIAIERGDKTLAQKHWKKALEIHPRCKEAKEELKILKRKKEKQ